MFISVKLIEYFTVTTTTTTITLPVVNHHELRKRINNFIKKKDTKYFTGIENSHLCKKLFQKNSCELAAFPKRKLDKGSISCGDLLVCALSPKKGIVLCFIPSTEKPFLRCAKMIKKFPGINYLHCNEASTCLLSKIEISFLACEEGMIDVDTNGVCTLQGLEISLLRYRNTHQTLFCKRITSNLLIQSQLYIMGDVSSGYILVDCVSKEKDFCFKVGLPVFSQAEVAAKVSSARQDRAASLNFHCLSEDTSLCFMTIFPNNTTHHVVSFPGSMFLSLPFGLIEQGQLLLSQKEEGCIFECTSISDLFVSGISNLFVSGKKKSARHLGTFYDWQVGSHLYMQTNQSIKNITFFSDPSVTIVRKEGSKEFFVVGAQIKLICSTKGVWGVCFVKKGTPSSDLQEAATLIPCTKKKSNLVMEQGPSYSVQSSSDCDPNEGPSSHCDPEEGPSSHCVQSSLNCDPEERPSQGETKRSAECLGLNFFDQDLLWSLVDFDPGKGPSSHCDPEEGPSSHCDPEEGPSSHCDPEEGPSSHCDPEEGPSSHCDPEEGPSSHCDPEEGPSSHCDPEEGPSSHCDPEEGPSSHCDPEERSSSHCDPEEGPSSHCVQSSLNCDPEERPSQGETKRSAECLGLHFFDQDLLWSLVDFDPGKGPSSHCDPEEGSSSHCDPEEGPSSHCVQSSLNCDPEERPSQGETKRSAECLGLHFFDQDLLWSLVDFDPGKGPSSHCDPEERSSSHCDPEEGPSSHCVQSSLNCDPEERPSQGETKRSAECLGLHFFDQDLLWSLVDFDPGKGPSSHCDPEEGSSSHCDPEEGSSSHCDPEEGSSSHCDPEEGSSSHCDPEEGPSSHCVQSSLNCDPEERPSQGETKRSAECLGLHFFDQDLLWSLDFDPGKGPSSHCDPEEGPSSHCVQSSLNCDPEERPSQGETKRSAECLGLHFFDQDLLWSSDFNPGKGPSSHCDPEEGPSSHCVQSSLNCDPEERPSQGATKRSAECLGLHFFDQDLLWSSNFDPGKGPSSQGAKKRSEECLGLKCTDQDPL